MYNCYSNQNYYVLFCIFDEINFDNLFVMFTYGAIADFVQDGCNSPYFYMLYIVTFVNPVRIQSLNMYIRLSFS